MPTRRKQVLKITKRKSRIKSWLVNGSCTWSIKNKNIYPTSRGWCGWWAGGSDYGSSKIFVSCVNIVLVHLFWQQGVILFHSSTCMHVATTVFPTFLRGRRDHDSDMVPSIYTYSHRSFIKENFSLFLLLIFFRNILYGVYEQPPTRKRV
jgi:hypothetical protein